ncbi:hypothetical protein FF100_01305 [Methylobacterium terricola]|uniref:TadE-like protein n=1 Tax=Methylobacterium terricola TaxID=2583531 RepID=A0A5C4LM69_9HYPH|nr:hypothetical protein [Methylobacterium terricola]TNC15932.1 hypothetical protein FF100_01305 [Methylobacterium terricola]
MRRPYALRSVASRSGARLRACLQAWKAATAATAPAGAPASGGGARPIAAALGLIRGQGGSASVEIALLAWPTMIALVGILQFVVAQYTQLLLGNALYDSAATPEAELLLGASSTYKATLCRKIRIVPSDTCRAQIIVEMMRLTDAPSVATSITGSTFDAGSANDALLLRAALPTLRVLPVIPAMTAQASVVFRR